MATQSPSQTAQRDATGSHLSESTGRADTQAGQLGYSACQQVAAGWARNPGMKIEYCERAPIHSADVTRIAQTGRINANLEYLTDDEESFICRSTTCRDMP